MARRRRRGTGSITRRRDGLYVAQVSLGTKADGTRDRRSFSSRLRGDVEFWLRESTRGHARGEEQLAAATVGDYLEDWLTAVAPSVRPMTARGYRMHVETWILPVLGREPLIRLAASDVRRVVTGVTKAGRAPRTAQSVLVTFRMALTAAVRDGRLERNVAAGVKAPRAVRRKVSATTPAEARRILDAFEGHWMEPLVTTAIGTGMRLGELLGLRWTDVSRGQVHVVGAVRPAPRADGRGYVLEWTEPKTARSIRTLEPGPFVFEALERQRHAQARTGVSEYVFTTPGGGWLDPRNVTRAFQRQLEVSGLPRLRFHDTRHAYATLSLAAGVPLRVIQEALGHTSITMTAAVYAHVLPELQRDAGQRLQEALLGR